MGKKVGTLSKSLRILPRFANKLTKQVYSSMPKIGLSSLTKRRRTKKSKKTQKRRRNKGKK